MKMKKQGVSLMTLIITIVIMSILTGTIIISITNSNTIDNAKDAVKRYTLAEVTQFANIAYGEAVMDKLTNTEEILKFIKAELKEYGIDIRYYKIALNGNKVTVANRESEPWRFKADSSGKYEYVTNGDITLNIGDTVNYDETKGGTKTNLTNVDWRVLGANEDGDLLLASNICVQNLTLTGQEGYITGIDKLNKISREYGYGQGAAYARSIEIDDVNSITEYVPNSAGEISYYWDGDEYPNYVHVIQQGDILRGEMYYSHANGFYYNDTFSPKPTNLEEKELIATFKVNNYEYEFWNGVMKVDIIEKLFEIEPYWYASKGHSKGTFGLFVAKRSIWSGFVAVGYEELFKTHEQAIPGLTLGVRPVVVLESNIELDKVTSGVWNIK